MFASEYAEAIRIGTSFNAGIALTFPLNSKPSISGIIKSVMIKLIGACSASFARESVPFRADTVCYPCCSSASWNSFVFTGLSSTIRMAIMLPLRQVIQ